MGSHALLAHKHLKDASLLNELQQASTNFPALPGPQPVLAIEDGTRAPLAVGHRREPTGPLNLWLEVSKRLEVFDNVHLRAVCKMLRGAVRGHSNS